MAETWTRLMLADGTMVLDEAGRMVLVDSDDNCCPGEYCADVRCIMPACLNVDICGIRLCRCFSFRNEAGEVVTVPYRRFTFDNPIDVFGRHVVQIDAECGWFGPTGHTLSGPYYYEGPRFEMTQWLGCGCGENEEDFSSNSCVVSVNSSCNGAANFFHDSYDGDTLTGSSNIRLVIEVKIVDEGAKLQVRAWAALGFCYGFQWILFEGQANIPSGWIDDCGRPTSTLTLTNLLTNCNCGGRGVSPLGYTYDIVIPGTGDSHTCLLWQSGSAMIAGSGGTVHVGAAADDPLPEPCEQGTDCPSQAQTYPCEDGDCDVCDTWGLPSSITVSGLNEVDCSDVFVECHGCGISGDSVVLHAQFFGSACNYFSDWYGCEDGGPLQVSVEATACGAWTLYIAGDFGYWIGTKGWDDGDPTGIYTKTGGSSPGPATLTVS